jgi:N-acetyl sugar amidotransferase
LIKRHIESFAHYFCTMSTTPYQQCSRCVMDTTDPEIRFNEAGECNHCNEFLDKRARHKYQGESSDLELARLVEEMKAAGKGAEYDCVVGLSGGIDSCYAAYIARQHGLRVLAVHLDNGWNSEEAVQNIRKIAQKLKVGYESYVLDWEEFKDIQIAFLRASVPEADTPTDIAILSALHKVAAKHGVKHIISGGNFATEGILPKHWHYNAKDLRYFNHIYKKFGKGKLKTFPTFGFKAEMYYKLVKRIRMVYLLNYVPYEKDKTIDFLQKELDWKYYGGKHYESKYTGFIQSYYLYTKFGIDYRRATFSSQICTGEVSREEALEVLKHLPYDPVKVEDEKKYIAKKLGFSIDEFEELLKLPPHWYSDYPNDEKRLTFIYDTYRKLFKKEKLASF